MPAPKALPKAPLRAAPASLRSAQKPAGRKLLVWLTLAVALVHLAVLQGVPDMLDNFNADSGTSANPPAFNTRLIPPQPETKPVAPPKPRMPKPAATPEPTVVPPPASDSQPAQASTQQPSQDAALPSESASGPTDSTAPSTATAANPSNAASAPGASAQVASSTANPPPAEPPPKMALPPSMRLLYDVKGVVTYAYTGGSELLWINQGNGYNARLQITKFGFNLRTWTSRGELTEQGLAPLRFGDKTRNEIASHFQRDKGIVSFSANTPDSPLLPGAQDYLSSFFQLAGMLAGEPQRYPTGTLIAFQVVNARSAEPWVFRVDGPQTVELPDGPKPGIKLTREHDVQYDTKVELWLAPDLSYVPIRIRLSQGNGDFAELLWRSVQKPD